MLLVCLQRVCRHASRPSRSRLWLFVLWLSVVVCMRACILTWFALTHYCVLVSVSFISFACLFKYAAHLQIICWDIIYTWGVQVSPCGWPWINFAVSLFCFFRAGAQPPAGRTSPQRTVWWWRCRPVRPAPGSCRLSWPAICWWPTFCWSTFSSLSSSTYIGMSSNAVTPTTTSDVIFTVVLSGDPKIESN